MSKYFFHQDPGHGWLEVPMSELKSLGISGQISAYSYQDYAGRRAYLEEDCDLSVFARAKGWAPGADCGEIQEVHSNHESPIRGLPSYRAPA